MQTKYKTRLLSLTLAACLALNLCTTAALAAEGTEQPGATGEEPYGVTYLWESVESDGGGCRARFNWMTGTDITQSVLLYAKKSDFETFYNHAESDDCVVIHIKHSLTNRNVEKTPKNGRERITVIPRWVYEFIKPVMMLSKTDLCFSNTFLVK